MKYFKYWVKESFQIRIDESLKIIEILCGSNESKKAAREEAGIQALRIENRISKREQKEEYQVAIKEHIDEIIDESNIVSICRYGAKILNTTQYTILDLDDYPFSILDLFRGLKSMSKKEIIVHKFLKNMKRHPTLGRDFRIYETTKGIRVIGKKYIEPAGRSYTALMSKLCVDWIYIQMSKKQNCYRARITPKPYRMKADTIRIKSPLDCETNEYREWAKNYEAISQNYSVVKLIKTIGTDFSGEQAIRLHDTVCHLDKNGKLV